MAVDISFVLVVRVAGAEDGGANGAGKVLDVVFAVQGCDVRAAKGAVTLRCASGLEALGEFASFARSSWADNLCLAATQGNGKVFRLPPAARLLGGLTPPGPVPEQAWAYPAAW